jgi:murein tripeptide amidase MpaA
MNKKIVSIFLCTLLLTVISSTAMNMNTSKKNEDDVLVLVRIDISKNQVDIPVDMEIVGSNPGEWIDIIIPKTRLFELSNLGIEYKVVIWDVIKYDNSVRGTYHTLSEMETILETIADDYPDITDLYSIGSTYEGRDIWCLEITDNPGVDEGEPGVFFMGLHHAREWPTVEICLNIVNQLTSKYGSNQQITDLVDGRRIWVVPCVNPDGYYYCHDLGFDWRKNRRPYPGGIGVDLNRNYGGSSDGDPWGSWGSVHSGAATHDPGEEVYCGPAPFSEAEIQAISNVFLENDIQASITWHTYSELVMWPWGYTPSHAPDYTYLKQVGEQIASKITRDSGSGTYTPQQSCTLYPTTGDTTDWAYGYGQYIQGRPTFAYTIEACSSFHPSASYLDQIVTENFDGALYLLAEAENIKNNVIPRVLPSIIDEMELDADGEYNVTWQEQNPSANPSKFQLDELIGPNIGTDDAESGSGYWTLNGFSSSTERYHSSSHSYKSGPDNDQVYTMVTNDPIPVTTGMKLDFWCWYNLEENYDMTFAEVSFDGRTYDIIDSFTGSSGDWQHKQYSLDNYTGESIFIRIRYVTDSYTLNEGFYIDDISPLIEWDSITTLSDTITNNSYNITGKQDGTYYYRVKGYNSERGWCDFSTLEEIEVEISYNDPPNDPTINGPIKGKPGQEYNYTFSSVDPDNDNVYFYIEWGDGDTEEWIGPYTSGEEVLVNHIWAKKGTYTIKAKAKDIYDAESGFESYTVTIPRLRSLFLNLFEKFPNLYLVYHYIFNFI